MSSVQRMSRGVPVKDGLSRPRPTRPYVRPWADHDDDDDDDGNHGNSDAARRHGDTSQTRQPVLSNLANTRAAPSSAGMYSHRYHRTVCAALKLLQIIISYNQSPESCNVWYRCRISLSRFLAECRKRRLNHGSFVLLCFALFACIKLYFVCVFSCTVLFVSQSSDWP